MKMKRTMPFIFIPGTLALQWAGLIFIFLSLRCDTTEPPMPKASLSLTLEDVSCNEAWIMLKLNNLNLPATVTLYKNSVAQNNILCYGDTVLYVDSLLPKQTYKFQSFSQSSNQSIVSTELSVTTMDTTSHNFTFQTWTFGEHSSSVLYDVAIINENNIWAVGEIYMKDSLGRPDPNSYNAVHWDGTEWKLKRIKTYSACSSIDYAPLKSIYAFAENNIVVTSGGGMWWFDGNKWNAECSINPLLTGAINKLWGRSSNDLYAVGNGGNIAHYSNGSWRKIESGTTIDLLDVWGTPDGSIVWACGYDPGYYKTVLLQYKSKVIKKFYEGSPNNQINGFYVGLFDGIWTDSDNITYFINWGGICSINFNDFNNFKLFTPVLSDIGFAMSASKKNNIFITGQHGLLAHFNGLSIKEYVELRNNKDYLYGINVKIDLVCSIGSRTVNVIYSQAIIHLIKTQGD